MVVAAGRECAMRTHLKVVAMVTALAGSRCKVEWVKQRFRR
jgi:hypothetical protein